MTYSSGTITSASPASALLTAFDTAILAVTGWSKVSSAIVVGTNTWNVYKSAGTSNVFGSDFYVALGYTTATPTILHQSIFEGWNTGTLLASNFPPNTTQTPTASFANPNAAVALPSTGTTLAYIDSPAFVTTGFTYGISVTADRFYWWASSNSVEIGFYAGLYDAFLPVAVDPFPICLLQLGPNASAAGLALSGLPASLSGLATREPGQTASSPTNFAAGTNGAVASSWTQNNSTSVEIYTQKIMISRVVLYGRSAGAYRGLLKDCYMGPAQTHAGDQMTWTLNSVAYLASRLGAAGSFAIYGAQI